MTHRAKRGTVQHSRFILQYNINICNCKCIQENAKKGLIYITSIGLFDHQ